MQAMRLRARVHALGMARDLLPRGRTLPLDVWAFRHRCIQVVLWLHVLGIGVFAVLRGYDPLHVLADVAVVALAALAAGWGTLSRLTRSCLATFGLVLSSAVLVHVSGGMIELHFHFFFVLAAVTLYQEWPPFLIAIGFVVLHHGVLGVLAPRAVYNHPDAWAHPWTWALVHGGFVLAASVANVTSWSLNERQAFDPLTRLHNRAVFTERLKQAVDRAARQGSLTAVLLIDLDGFKAVNDSQGHAVGDAVLVTVARRLKASVRGGDLVSRFGGDEFAILCEDVPSPAAASDLADRLAAALRDPIEVGTSRMVVGCSVGVASGGAGQGGALDLLRDADLAMYVAKGRGKGRVQRYEPGMHAAVVDRLELQGDLRLAVSRGELSVHYQPILALASGEMIGVEALVRWQHPRRGLLAPALFIPLAEEIGVVHDLGRFVLSTACRQLTAWQEAHPDRPPLALNVNLSGCQLERADLMDEVTAVLHATGFDPALLVLEITETVLLGNTGTVTARLGQMRLLGIRIAIDDFGTGYSSLSYLRDFPVDVVKIDKSFVDLLTGEPETAALTRAVVEMAAALHLRTTAEGIEHVRQVEQLLALGCETGQGYHFSRPLPAPALEALLLRSRQGPHPALQGGAGA